MSPPPVDALSRPADGAGRRGGAQGKRVAETDETMHVEGPLNSTLLDAPRGALLALGALLGTDSDDHRRP